MRPDSPASDRPLVGSAIAGLLLTLGLLSSDFSPFTATLPAEDPFGSLEGVLGTVQRRHQGSLVWRPLPSGARLYAGDSVFTGADSRGSIRLQDGSVLEIDASSLVVLGGTGRRAPAVSLEEGRLRGEASARGLRVRTRGSVAELDGHAIADVVVERDRIEMVPASGRVVVASGTLPALAVETGSAVRIGRDGASVLQWPLRLLRPDAGAFFVYRDELPHVDLAWSGDTPAGTVRLACGLETVRRIPIGPRDTRVRVLMEGPGLCRWRLLDANGTELSEERRFAIVQDRPPVPLHPGHDDVVLSPTGEVVLSWTRVNGTNRYVTELAADPSFPEGMIRRAISGTEQTVLQLPPSEQRFYWRVRGEDPRWQPGSWSAVQSFRLTPFAASAAPSRLDAEVRIDAP